MKYNLLEPAVDGLHRIQALKDFGNVKTGDLGVGSKMNPTSVMKVSVGSLMMPRSLVMPRSMVMPRSLVIQGL